MARLLVGLPGLQGNIQETKDRFDMVELRPVDTSVPRVATLRKWRKAVPPTFVFSVILPRVVGELASGEEADAALATSLEVAAALEARCILLHTPPSIRPTASNRRRIVALFERVPAAGVVRCWEPSGMWEYEDVIATARAAGALPVLDAARDPLPPGPIVYTRLRALGKSTALGEGTIDKIADALRDRREAFVIVEGQGAARVKKALLAAVAKSRVRSSGPTIVRPSVPPTLIAEDEEQ